MPSKPEIPTAEEWQSMAAQFQQIMLVPATKPSELYPWIARSAMQAGRLLCRAATAGWSPTDLPAAIIAKTHQEPPRGNAWHDGKHPWDDPEGDGFKAMMVWRISSAYMAKMAPGRFGINPPELRPAARADDNPGWPATVDLCRRLAASYAAVCRLIAARCTNEQAEPQDIVTLDEVSALCRRAKRTLERDLKDGHLPQPDYPGGGGRAHKWIYDNLRPDLEKVAGIRLPAKFPGSRFVS